MPGGVIFGVKPVAETLMNVVRKKDINVRYHHTLVEVDGEKQIAWYKVTKDPKAGGCVIMSDNSAEIIDETINFNNKNINVIRREDGMYGIHFDIMHLAPPQTAPDFIRNSSVANEGGWIDVDIHTMQHKRFANVFGIGDAAALPTAKTGAAIENKFRL